MARHAGQLTYDDYVHFPSDRRWELIGGVRVVVPAPNIRHQIVVGRLHLALGSHLERHGGGVVLASPVDAVLREDDVLQPDLVFVADDDRDVITDDNLWGTPTWVIEVLSDPYREQRKLARYEAAGVREHWLANPYEDWLEIRIHDGTAYTAPTVHRPPARIAPMSLPGAAVDLGYVFRRD